MSSKTKLLVVGITMNCAGTEKSFLSFLSALDFTRFDVTLLLAKREGLLFDQLPPEVKVTVMKKYGDMFLLSGKNAVKTLANCFVKENPLTLFEILPYFLKTLFSKGEKRSSAATRMWLHFMKKMPEVEDEYDVAVAYWGDRTMFYLCDKVRAKKKITWLHFDYANPPRDDSIYLPYFKKCDKIVTVSRLVDDALKTKLPEIADRTVVMENIISSEQIRALSALGDTFADTDFTGKRILTVGRISDQKGIDLIPPVVKRLLEDGFNIRWYILGDGDEGYKQSVEKQLADLGVSDTLVFLGATQNPYRYIADCDIYAQPSRHEGKPIAVEEAKMLCKPILAAHYLSAPEQLENGALGVICDIDSDSIYSGIKTLLTDENLCASLKETLAKRDFSNSKEIEKFYKMIQ